MTISNSSSSTIIASSEVLENHGFNARMIALNTTVIGCWALRFAINRSKAYKDARAVFVTFCVLNRSLLIGNLCNLAFQWHIRGSHIAWSCALALVSWCAWQTQRKIDIMSREGDRQEEAMFLTPSMIPCRTTHSRLFPTKHSFSYSYLYVGIPVGWRGYAGSLLSADSDPSNIHRRKTWFSVAAEDYLERGVHEQGLEGKLQDYLASQNVSPGMYAYAYLVTAPSFLGFSFNPVSFWYLYDSKRSLAAMILEVNNTFDERRMYFMERRADSDESEELGVKFTQEWQKDFHVSPFNDRAGTYSVQSTNPFDGSIEGRCKVDNNIVLKSEDGKPKIVARVFSTEPGIDARIMSSWETFLFVLRWWWVGFMTNPRILKEARTLWAKKLQLYYRPEVLNSSIGRNETLDEVKLEVFFRDLLDQLAISTGIIFRYKAAAGPLRAKQIEIRSTWAHEENPPCPEIEICILTPAFYSQLVRYRSLLEAFDRHCFQAADGEAMVDCTHPGALREVLARFSALLRTGFGSTVGWHIDATLDQYSVPQVLWQSLIMSLRSGNSSGFRMKPSDFDVCVLRRSSRLSIGPYYKITLKLLLTDRFALGWLPILKLEETCVWSLLVLAEASAIRDLLGLRSPTSSRVVPTLLKLCGVHIWSASV